MTRRLIVCCDGTWQDLDTSYPTNVVKMAQAIKLVGDRGIPQILYYDQGIGTKSIGIQHSIIDFLTRIVGGGLGLGIDQKIQTAYRFLCLNYQPGDEIYLFGFSRGAYTVRCLSGLIYNSGLLHRKFIRKIPQAYELYREKQNPDNAPKGKNAVEFRQKYGQDVPIKALCCWDTVASLGIPDIVNWLKLSEKFNERYRFFDSTVNSTIEKAIHAVAIDELRKAFDVTLMENSSKRSSDQVKEVWFPGVHGSVGGGEQKNRGLSDAALLWMMEEVEKLGLDLDKSSVEEPIKPDYKTFFDNQPQSFYRLAKINIREIPGNFEDLHASVKQRWKDPSISPPYRPKNLEKFRQQLDGDN